MTTTVPLRVDEVALTESRSLRAQYVTRVDVLEKVKALTLLPDGVHATTEIVAGYYEVPVETIKSLVKDNREELTANELRTLRGAELRSLKDLSGIDPRVPHLTVFTRRTMLNVGQLLTESQVARQVRTYLLNVEESATPAHRAAAVVGVVPPKEQAEILSILRPMLPESYATAKSKLILARSMGEVPELDPAEMPLYASDYLAGKGHSRKAVRKFEVSFGIRLSNRYLQVHGHRPEKVPGPADSRITKIAYYTEADRSLMDEVYGQIADLIAAFEDGAA